MTKKQKLEIMHVYDKWMNSYLNGDVKTYDSFLDVDYRFIGSTNNEEFLDKNDTTNFFKVTADQLAGKAERRNSIITVEQLDGLVFITDLFDAYFLNGDDWAYYGRFRFTSAMRKNKNGWRFIYQHFSTPDAKAQEGETLGTEQISKENQELRDAIKRRTIELEQKNRELAIEGALGRIRAQAVAMKTSSELLDIVVTMRNEFTKLGHEAHYFWHMMWLPETYEKAMTSGDGSKIGFVMKLPRHIHGDIPLLADWEKSDNDIVIYPMNAKAAINYVDKMVNLGDFQNIDPQAPTHDDIKHIGGLTFIMARTTHGEIGYSLPGVVKNPPKEDLDILVQFAGAFDLAHRRFLDLQKAEKQAREVQIELAIEKVRSRTMAMQHSDELQETSFLLDQQVRALGIKTWGCAFNIYGEKDSTEWFGNEKGVLPTYIVPRAGIFKDYYKKGKKGESLFVQEFDGKACVDHYEYMSTLPVIGDVLKKLKETNNGFPTYQIDHVAYFKYGYLLFITKEHVPDAYDIFKRFAKVFEQTYTRFLDLQKAEAQAREAQIETALERVRSRTMAMQNSDELSEVILEVLKKLQDLGISMEQRATAIFTFEAGNKDYEQWVASPEYKSILSFLTPYFDHPVQNDIWKARQNGTEFYAKSYAVEEKNSLFKYLFNLPALKNMPQAEKTKALKFKYYNISIAFRKNAALVVVSHSGIPLTEAENSVLKRLVKVFEQTYTRFLDLQKAEAQAKEAQIEAALERVRSRSMAMHNSEELTEAGALLYQELSKLGIQNLVTGYTLFDETATLGWNYGVNPMDGGIRDKPMGMKHTTNKVMKKIASSWKKQEPLLVIELNEKETIKHQTFIAEESIEFPISKEKLLSISPEKLVIHTFNFKQGYLLIVGGELLNVEQREMISRFAKVFQQTYTRFLDLQKAEIQARESQIELGLERVRARAMAMQHSDELSDLVATVLNELTKLDFALTWCIINIINEADQSNMVWATNPEGGAAPDSYYMKFEDYPYHHAVMNAWKAQKSKFVYTLEGKEKKIYDDYLYHETEFKRFSNKVKKANRALDRYVASFTFSNFGGLQTVSSEPLSDDNLDILERFGKVFDLTYTRFNDLQKAEAQAKEAQIETALERVRSRSMAMHNSNEIGDVALVLFQQLKSLGGELWGTGFGFCKKDSDVDEYWFANEKGIMPQLKIPNTVDPAHKQMYQGWKKNLELLSIVKDGKALKDHYKYMLTVPDVQPIFQGMLDNGIAFPKWQKWHAAYFKYGYLLVITTEEYKNEAVFKRFAKVFEQAYTRFLDLQKAEAQAKEAQIEAALERVRSQSMGMQTSKDLSKVTTEMFNQLRQFGGDLYATGIVFCDKQKGHVEQWHSLPDAGMISPFIVPIDLDYIHQYRYDQWRKGTALFSIEIPSDFIAQHFNDIFKLPSAQVVLKEFEANKIPMPPTPDWEIDYGASFKHGYILVSSLQPFKETEILPRFAKVFEQTYTRFLDLKKAEAQAKEAQIETALERVRSRSMAMHKSDELKDVVKEIFDQMAHLKINADHAGIVVDYEPKKDFNFWVADKQNIPAKITVPYLDLPWDKQFTEAKKKSTDFFTTQLDFEEKNSFYKKLLPHIKGLTKKAKDFYLNCPGLAASTVIQRDIGLYIENFSGLPFSDEENSTLMRFGKVFQQTYTRFLDLQKAEAQAKEAQIENALEKVRSRTMAMQNSSELPEAANNLFLQVQELGIPAWSAGYCIWEKDQKSATAFMSSEGVIQKPFVLPSIGVGYNFSKPLKNGDLFHVGELGGNLIKKHYEFMRTLPIFGEVIDGILEAGHPLPTFQIFHICYFKYGYVMFITYETVPKAHDIFKRFAKVFEQTYTRFLDLKKAEAQTRESQIEVAVERIRAQSMAMHHPDDLENVNSEIYTQLQLLNINGLTGVSIWLVDENNFVKIWDLSSPGNMGNPNSYSVAYDAKEYDILGEPIRILKKSKKDYFVLDYPLEKLQKAVKEWSFADKNIANDIKDAIATGKLTQQWNPFARHNSGLLSIDLVAPPNEDTKTIVTKITGAFNQAYTRFLDLQKAEAQTREAQIEAALERTRTQSMLMQHSNELSTTTQVFHEQLQLLGIDSEFSYLWLPDETEKNHLFWATWSEIKKRKTIYKNKAVTFPLDKKEPSIAACYIAWESGETIHINPVQPDQVEDYFNTWSELLNGVEKFKPELFPEGLFYIDAYMDYGCFGIMIKRQLNDDEKNILSRFSKEFQRTYTRFLDLQKAEAQTKEAKIEAALEKVRSRTMAMQKGEEVKDVVVLLYKELITLGVTNFATCGYVEINEETQLQSTWVTSPGGDSLGLFYLPLTGDVYFDERYKAWKKQQTVFHQTVAGKVRRKHLEYAITTFNSKEAEEMVLTQFPDPTVFYCFNFSHGYLHLVSGSYLTKEEEALLARFTKVFEQTYARFLDLEKAEAQTRTAQINLAVERVRAKALAMHKSEEIMEVVAKLKEEVMALDIPDVVAATIFLNEGDDKVRMWDLSTLEKDNNGYQIPFDITFKLKKSDPNLYVKRVWENPENYFIDVQEGKDFKRIIAWLRENNQDKIADEVEEYTETTNLKRLHHAVKKLNNGKLVIDLLNPPSDEMETILTKMGGAFDLAYKRFEDLQKAEAQTREAQIEAALEKVRSRSLAMHKPDELKEVVAVVAEKLKELGVIYDAGGVILCTYFPDNKDVVHWIAVDDFSTSGRYFVPYFDNPIFSEAWESKIKGDAYYFKEFPVEAKNEFFKHAFEHSDYRQMPEDYKQFVLQADSHNLTAAWSKNSAIIIPSLTGAVPSESDAEIIKRFAKVFEQAYIRFMDLQKAEERARESQIDIALERVRNRTLAMQTSEELAETSMVVFQQLVALGIAPNRLFIGIIKDKGASIEAWATNEDGSKIESRFTLQASKNKSINKMITGSKQDKKSLVIDMKGKELQDYFQYLNKEMSIPFIHGLEQKRRVQTIAYFSGGLIGMAAPDEQSEDSIRLLERFASVFNLTYTRFNDLKVAEAQSKKAEEDLINLQLAKKSAEKSLSELQQTQKQLIQSEKMASLGELTAGIAHEIQNPLNFVNNFSEVSKELLEEMLEEIEKGDMEEVRAIMADVIQNLDKINHHGNRADGIVKGMLQHSRASGDKKEPTDINALADEYFRLAYHGLRAKDKSFNANLTTDFDENIGKVNVVPQDIGRVILNLITNAFYAVTEKTKQGIDGYQPEVTVKTQKVQNKLEIIVIDNGNGISEAIKEKIFQPFFTTKPTGSGTGLGLSLSYDIVKAHGGELTVNTVKNEGSEFIIKLPINK